jgi:CheY-like chemotaxis protein
LNAAGGLSPVVKDIDKVNILLIDDQPAKLLSYEVILGELGENLIKANSPQEALGLLLPASTASSSPP